MNVGRVNIKKVPKTGFFSCAHDTLDVKWCKLDITWIEFLWVLFVGLQHDAFLPFSPSKDESLSEVFEMLERCNILQWQWFICTINGYGKTYKQIIWKRYSGSGDKHSLDQFLQYNHVIQCSALRNSWGRCIIRFTVQSHKALSVHALQASIRVA